MAGGVLVIGIGAGTRVLEYLQGLSKTYRARFTIGLRSDTQDSTGRILQEADSSSVTAADVAAALAEFMGEGEQIPPMVSALKVRGQRLYDLARKGETVERDPRPITIYE